MELILGTAQFGFPYGIRAQGPVVDYDFDQIMATARVMGIKKLDTAFSYGEAHKRIISSKFFSNYDYITKIPDLQTNKNDGSIKKRLKDFLARSKVLFGNNLFGVLLHNQTDYVSNSEGVLSEVISDFGIANNIKFGCSCYDMDSVGGAINHGANFIQMSFNIFDQRLIDYRNIFTKNITLNVRSIFLQGALLMQLNEVEKIFPLHKEFFQKWHDWLNQNKLKALEGVLSHVKSLDFCSGVVIGVANKKELCEIVEVWQSVKPISAFEMRTSDKYLIDPRVWKR